MSEVAVRVALEDDAPLVHALTQQAFAAYARLEPPSGAIREDESVIAADLAAFGGLLALRGDEPVGAARFAEHSGGAWLRRVAVPPDERGHGVGSALVAAGLEEAARRGWRSLRVGVRHALVDNQAWWARRGFLQTAGHDYWVELARPVPVDALVPTAGDMGALGERLAGVARPGDLLVLSGDLGAGKTTLTQGIGVGLGVRGPVTSPTFVIARVHPSLAGGPALVHVDAYRLGSLDEVDDLDLDASLAESVTVVEWGEGKVEGLSADRLEVVLHRAHGAEEGELRRVLVRPMGRRWLDVELPV